MKESRDAIEFLTFHKNNNISEKSRLRPYYNVNSIAASEFSGMLKNPHRELVIIGLSPISRFPFKFRYYEFRQRQHDNMTSVIL